ncbi:hypothetical protein AB4Y77_01425 [Paenarthrobacter sp. YAF11_1]|uniref:phage distal tail protein n=1 Tax=Paenarthrobacter sp. YAF11_1 TaxID=3233074 RepID=UPI003F97BB67
MPYPSPITYPSRLLFPGTAIPENQGRSPIALGDLLMNWVDDDGTVWAVEENPGWLGSPASTAELTQRARGDGATSTEGFLQAKTLPMQGRIRAQTAELLSAAIDRLNHAVSVEPFNLIVAEAGRVRHMTVQRQDEILTSTVKGSATVATFSIQLSAKDPRKFGDVESHSTLLPKSSGGMTYPKTYPVTYTGVSNDGKLQIENQGNTNAPVWLRIDGPIPAGGWTVTHVGKRLQLSFATSIALSAGEFVTVDMDRREILAQGQSARAGYVTSRGWFSLDPGHNEIAFSAANYSATAQLTVTTKPAWS